jgi:hypothetical protein
MNRLPAWLPEGQVFVLVGPPSMREPVLSQYGSAFSISAYDELIQPYVSRLSSAWSSEDGGSWVRRQVSVELQSSSGSSLGLGQVGHAPVQPSEESDAIPSTAPPAPEPPLGYGLRRFTLERDFITVEELIEVHGVVRTLHALADQNETQRALDLIIRFFDGAMVNRKFLRCESALRIMKPSKLNGAMMISVLGITEGLGENCPARDAFYRSAIEALAEQRGRERAERLLRKFK